MGEKRGVYLKRKEMIADSESAVDIPSIVRRVLTEIKARGEEAVREFSIQFDGWNPPTFRVSEDEIKKAISQLPLTFIEDTRQCQKQVREFAKVQLATLAEVEVELQPGVTLGHKLIPIANVGAYVPGGRYPIIASAHMSIIPPKVAGCERVIVCTPPQKDGSGIHPGVLFAIHEAGADEIYALGGIQAIGAMAYGTENIKSVDFLVGPGNAFVAEAKRQVFGEVGIDQIAGPTEILVLADETADPEIVAADLLGQSEHDVNAKAILVTTSHSLAEQTIKEMEKQLPQLTTADIIRQSWKRNGEIYVAVDKEDAINVTNEYAIEHLELQVANPDDYIDHLTNYGSLFIGEETTVAYGDKGIGTNHILPTGRAARYTGGLWVGKFIKTVTYQKCTREASRKLAPLISRQCQVEGMHAHAVSADKRVIKYGAK